MTVVTPKTQCNAPKLTFLNFCYDNTYDMTT